MGFNCFFCRVMLIFCANTSCSSYFRFSLIVTGVSFLATQLNGVVLFPYLHLKLHFWIAIMMFIKYSGMQCWCAVRDPSFWKFPFWGIPHFRNSGTGKKQTVFFGGLTQFFVPIFPSSQSSCTWHGYFKKTWVLAPFFWLQGPMIQSSAAPQGSPPPTQQIKIQMQISWVGWSTTS